MKFSLLIVLLISSIQIKIQLAEKETGLQEREESDDPKEEEASWEEDSDRQSREEQRVVQELEEEDNDLRKRREAEDTIISGGGGSRPLSWVKLRTTGGGRQKRWAYCGWYSPCRQPTGVFPDPMSCCTFYICDECRPFKQRCGDGTHFNPRIGACDFPMAAGCIARIRECSNEDA